MQQYDIALKTLVLRSAALFLGQVSGASAARWLEVELPRISSRRADLLGETPDGDLIQLEFQSRNDPDMLLRMAEYSWAIYRKTRKFPRQTVVYVGRAEMRMRWKLDQLPDRFFRYRLVDIRELDGDQLIEQGGTGDSILAVLARLRDNRAAVAKIVKRIAKLKPQPREEALRMLTVLAGLRKMEDLVEEEGARVPIIIDIMQNKLYGPKIREALKQGQKKGLEVGQKKGLAQGHKQGLEQGLEQGHKQGLKEGVQKGRQEGELTILSRLMELRFGPLPAWAKRSLSAIPASQLAELTESVYRATSMRDLLK